MVGVDCFPEPWPSFSRRSALIKALSESWASMLVLDASRYFGAVWILLVLVSFVAADATSPRSLLLLALVATVPPLLVRALWRHHLSPPTIAEVLHNVEHR
jgi:hypothetical protein